MINKVDHPDVRLTIILLTVLLPLSKFCEAQQVPPSLCLLVLSYWLDLVLFSYFPQLVLNNLKFPSCLYSSGLSRAGGSGFPVYAGPNGRPRGAAMKLLRGQGTGNGDHLARPRAPRAIM